MAGKAREFLRGLQLRAIRLAETGIYTWGWLARFTKLHKNLVRTTVQGEAK